MGIEKALIINYRLQLSNARPLHWSIFPSLTPPPARPDLSLGPLLPLQPPTTTTTTTTITISLYFIYLFARCDICPSFIASVAIYSKDIIIYRLPIMRIGKEKG